MESSIEHLALEVNGEVVGDPTYLIDGVHSIEAAGPRHITFAQDQSHARKLKTSRAGAALISQDVAENFTDDDLPPSSIVVDDAQAAFIKLINLFHPAPPRKEIGVSPTATVDPSAVIGAGSNIHPNAVIGAHVTIGENCEIHPGACIGDNCTIGDDCVIHANTVLYPNVELQNRVVVHASAVLGADGFGYRFEDGRFVRIPHVGSVLVEDDVEIGACTTIDRGMVGPTVIGTGTKLDNLVMIAHNCRLGSHNAYASQVGFAGSVTTGDYVRCAGQVGVADHTHIGDAATLGAKVGVHKDLPGNQTYLGAPARPAEEEIRVVMSRGKLPEMRRQLRQAQKDLAELAARVAELVPETPST